MFLPGRHPISVHLFIHSLALTGHRKHGLVQDRLKENGSNFYIIFMNFFKKFDFKGKKHCFVEFLHTLSWPRHAAFLGLPSGTSRLKGSFQEDLDKTKK